jgi:hypothetical protein
LEEHIDIRREACSQQLFDRVLRIKESDSQTMMGTEIVAVFLKHRIKPVMSRTHQMWLYLGPKDETRVNVAELSEKELLDEVRRLTHFSQEDSIPLLALQEPYDFDHQPTEVNLFSVHAYICVRYTLFLPIKSLLDPIGSINCRMFANFL